MSYIIRKRGADRFHYITRTNHGRYFLNRKFQKAFSFKTIEIASSILELYRISDTEYKDGEWQIVPFDTAMKECWVRIDPEREGKVKQRKENFKSLTPKDFDDIKVLAKVNGMNAREIAIIYNISPKAVIRTVKQSI